MMYDYVHLTNKINWPPCSQKIARLLPSWRFTTKDPVESLANLVYHIMRAYYLTMHWKADQQISLLADITDCGWEFVTGALCVSTQCITRGPTTHPVRITVSVMLMQQ